MSFTGKEGGPVNLETLQKAVDSYKKKNPKTASSHFFGKDCIDQLMSQPGSIGIRVLHGIDENGEHQLYLVSVDENENDLLPGSSASAARGGTQYLIIDHSRPCPPYC